MNDLLILVCAGLCGLGLIFGVPAAIEYCRKRKNRKWFKSVQIGDRYIMDNREPNPFSSQWGGVITITDKRIGNNGLMYVKYRSGDSRYEESSSFELLIETYDYIPYTGQDKEQ